MDHGEARRLLGVEPDSTEAETRSAHAEKAQVLRGRAAAAPTDALRGKFERQAAELDMALGVLIGGGAPEPERDLPSARPSAPGGAAPVAAPAARSAERPGEIVSDRGWATARRSAGGDAGEDLITLRVPGAEAGAVQTLATAWRRLGRDDLDMTADGDALVFRAAGGDLLEAHIERGRKVRRQAPFDVTGTALADLARKLAELPPGLRLRQLDAAVVWRTPGGELIPLGLAAEPDDGDPARGADQAALGRLAMEILTNGAEQDPGELRRLRPDAPVAFVRALERGRAAQRHESLQAFAEALEGRAGGGVPPFLARRFPQLTPLHLLAAGGGLAAVVLLAATYPVWKSATPWQGASDKQEVARLSGVVKVMAARADHQAADARREADEAAQEALRLQEKLESVGVGADYDEILPRYIEAGLRKARAETVARELAAATGSSLEAAQLKLAEADSLLASDDIRDALPRYRSLEAEYRRLTSLPGHVRDGIARRETQQSGLLAGAWTDKDCTAAARWAVADGVLSVDWPGQGRFRERVLGADGDQVFTVGEAPEAQAGRLFSYRRDGAQLVASELGARPTRMTLKRC